MNLLVLVEAKWDTALNHTTPPFAVLSRTLLQAGRLVPLLGIVLVRVESQACGSHCSLSESFFLSESFHQASPYIFRFMSNISALMACSPHSLGLFPSWFFPPLHCPQRRIAYATPQKPQSTSITMPFSESLSTVQSLGLSRFGDFGLLRAQRPGPGLVANVVQLLQSEAMPKGCVASSRAFSSCLRCL